MKTLILTAALVFSGSALGQVYKCVEGGRTVFSDRPCAAEAERIDVRPATGEYDRAAGLRAESRRLTDESRLAEIEMQRRARARQSASPASRTDRNPPDECEQMRREHADAEHWAKTFRHPDNIKREQDRAKDLASKSFFGCAPDRRVTGFR